MVKLLFRLNPAEGVACMLEINLNGSGEIKVQSFYAKIPMHNNAALSWEQVEDNVKGHGETIREMIMSM